MPNYVLYNYERVIRYRKRNSSHYLPYTLSIPHPGKSQEKALLLGPGIQTFFCQEPSFGTGLNITAPSLFLFQLFIPMFFLNSYISVPYFHFIAKCHIQLCHFLKFFVLNHGCSVSWATLLYSNFCSHGFLYHEGYFTKQRSQTSLFDRYFSWLTI